MTSPTYTIRPDGPFWLLEKDGKMVGRVATKRLAEEWLGDVRNAQGDYGDVVWELRAIRKEQKRAGFWILFYLGLIFMAVGPCRAQSKPPQSEPPLPRLNRVEPFSVPSLALGSQARRCSVSESAIGETAAALLRCSPSVVFAQLGEPFDRDAGGMGASSSASVPGFPGVRRLAAGVCNRRRFVFRFFTMGELRHKTQFKNYAPTAETVWPQLDHICCQLQGFYEKFVHSTKHPPV